MSYYKIFITGKVQGVGFRPCVYNIAKKLHLCGYIRNLGSKVEILLDREPQSFLDFLKQNLPKQAVITNIQIKTDHSKTTYKDFFILESKISHNTIDGIIPQDLKICDECLKDIKEHQRFKHYAFTTCVNCGPRYSIIEKLPYDRKNTSMKNFKLCKACDKDYNNPLNRRFHAQPLSCNDCKIPLNFSYKSKIFYHKDAIHQCALAIKQGAIVAIKGIGGFALACSSNHLDTIQKIRNFKNRPFKPFAIMAKDISMAKKYACISKEEQKILRSKEAPIVLLRKKKPLQEIAPHLKNIGIVLPYSALHHLLFDYLDFPIIFTSANQSGEPIIADKTVLENTLGNLCDGILDYEREILNPIDDSVVQIINSKMQIIRFARGYAPLSIKVPQLKTTKNKVMAGMGAEQKITLAFRKNKNIVLSPYIGDLNNLATLKYYEKIYHLFSHLYSLPETIISDKHRGYHSYDISANKSSKSSILWETKQHHYAHFCAIFLDAMLQDSSLKPTENLLGIIWDGTGAGEDGNVWGGEFFIGNLKKVKRVGHFEAIEIFGTENSIKENYKTAYCFAKQLLDLQTFEKVKKYYHCKYPHIFPLFEAMVQKKLHSFYCTSVGRIFDAVASLCGICDVNTYDAQAPIMLEALYQEDKDYGTYPFLIHQNKIIEIGELFGAIIEDVFRGENQKIIATKFINTLAQIALDFTLKHPKTKKVLFSGGVFMNKALCERIYQTFSKHPDIKIYFHQFLPSNDSNIALGQVI
ncbi:MULTISPECIES: carbamoyltransferase HypF [unclassified Helicobacter]|uniref:carbamoyltransferase HypF n=1 Tax=unclassified Helicobacter TaxID=2593540 RepID=UPI000CF026A4|nr:MULTISPECIES: carbamoyltransferase HypF [unclassified Helicobacter]